MQNSFQSFPSFVCHRRLHALVFFKGGARGGIFISVFNFTAQKRASFGNQSILKFRVMEVRDTSLRSSWLKNMYLSHDFEPF